jgi:hypothetical protein
MRKERSKVGFYVSRFRKTDSGGWRGSTIKPLTYAELRIKHLCKAYLLGEITSADLKQELPAILDSRDREKHRHIL